MRFVLRGFMDQILTKILWHLLMDHNENKFEMKTVWKGNIQSN